LAGERRPATLPALTFGRSVSRTVGRRGHDITLY
jgi:hypothetical protein